VRHPFLDDLELHRPDGTEHGGLVAAQLGAHDLDDALVVELVDPTPELLVLARVRRTHHPEVLWREHRQRRELDRVAFEDRVADPQRRSVDEADDVAGPRLIRDLALPAEQVLGVLGGERPPARRVGDDHPAAELARAHPHEGDVVAVGRVHARLHLEHEAGERRAHGAVATGCVLAGLGGRREVDEGVQDVLHPEVEHGSGEEHRRGLVRQEPGLIVVLVFLGQQFRFLGGRDPGVAFFGGSGGGAQAFEGGGRCASGRAGEPDEFVGAAFDHSAEIPGDADRPGQRGGYESGAGADFVHQVEGLCARSVPLVDDGDHRQLALLADLEELHGLHLEALARVDEHDGGVDR
jgi:hypothetical protein